MNKVRTKKELIARGSCQGLPVHIFLDSGSGVSLVSPSFVKRLGRESEITECNAVLRSFSNDKVSVDGKITLGLCISNVMAARHDFIVTSMLDVEFLIGLDFLEQNNLITDFGKSTLRTQDGKECKLVEKPRDTPHVKRIRSEKIVTIPPNTVQFISGKLPPSRVNYQGITDPCHNTMQATGLFMSPAVVYSDKRWVPIRCANFSDEPMTIFRGSTLGYLRPATDGTQLSEVNLVDHQQGEQFTGPHSCPEQRDREQESRWTREGLYKALKVGDIDVDITEEERKRLKEVLWDNRSCFAVDNNDFGCCNMYKAHITLKRDFVPSWVPERKIPYKLESKMDELMDNMLSTGVVEPLTTESSWNSPLTLVAKSRPGEYRVCVDLRQANKQCLEDKYDLPNLNHVLDRIGGDSIFSTFDMAASFHQVPYDEASKPITAFSYKGRRFNFARLIMGHCSSSSIFTRVIYRMLEHVDIEHLIFFLDDLLVGSTDVSSHIDRLELLLRQLKKCNMKLTPKKSTLMCRSVKYVGVTLDASGISINDDRIEAVKALPIPTSVKETQSVLGFFGYNRKFISKYAELSGPLYALLQKGRKFEWTPQCAKAFEDLKTAVTTAPTLCFPDVEDPHDSYEVQLDGSNKGLGAMLTQMINGERRVVAFFSKAVPRHKREWGQTKIEFESLHASLKHWSVFLKGVRQFKVITDCLSLCNLDTIFSKTNPTLVRRLQDLADFNFHIEHISGVKNHVADFLSRYGMGREADKATQTPEDGEWNTCMIARPSVMEISPHSTVEHKSSSVLPHCNDTTVPCSVLPHCNNNALPCPVLPHCNDITKSCDVLPLCNNINTPFDVVPHCIDTRVDIPSHNDTGELIREGAGVNVINGKGKGEVDSLAEVDLTGQGDGQAEGSSYLQLLFDGNIENDDCRGSVMTRTYENTDKVYCLCSVPEKPRELTVPQEPSETVHAIESLELPEVKELIKDKDSIRKAQDEDGILKEVKEWVRKKERPKLQTNRTPPELVSYWKQFNLLRISDGLLMRRWVSKKDIDKGRDLFVIPDRLMEQVMELHHRSTTCHPGVDQSVELCRRNFYWPKMQEEFKEYIGACEKCHAVKPPNRYLKAELKHMLFHNFNDCVVVDHIVPDAEKRTARGFRYILTITDAWSNYVVAIPVRTQTAKENISQIVRRWTLTYGLPKEIIVDNHPGFTADFFEQVMQYFDCKVTHGTSYHSRSTGKAERSNKRVNQALRASIPVGKENQWDIYLGYAVFALNCLRNRHTGYSSNRLVFGRELNTPITLLVDNELKTETLTRQSAAYEQYKLMKNTIKKVRENANADFMYAKNQHEKNILGPFFKAGDLCYVLVSCPSHKFSIRWRGPFMINKAINDHLYVVQMAPGVDKVVNLGKMKHFQRNKYNQNKYPAVGNPTVTNVPVHEESKQPNVDSSDESSDEEFVIKCAPPRRRIPSPITVPDSRQETTPEQIVPVDVEVEQSPQQAQEESSDTLDDSLSPVRLSGSPNTSAARSPEVPSVDRTEADPTVEEPPSRRYNLRDRTRISAPDRL